MNKRLFVFVIILMAISLAGIILLQLFWIRNAIDIREEHFDKTVNVALRETAAKLESNENIFILNERIGDYGKPAAGLVYFSDSIDEDEFIYYDDSNQSISYSYSISSDEHEDVMVEVWTGTGDDELEIIEYKHEITADSIRKHVSELHASINIDSLSQVFTHDILYVGEGGDTIIEGSDEGYFIIKKAQNLSEAFMKMAYEIESTPIPITERLDTILLYEVLAGALFNKGIQAEFEYGVLCLDDEKTFPLTSAGFNSHDLDKRYIVSLFPNELQEKSNFLILQFPGRNAHVLKSMAWTLAGSLLLTLIILATFGITLYMILRQKKLSDIKSDFINNMTHEFKTPIATISLAVDSINSPKIIHNADEIRYYTGIIREENHRMNNQVESVLRMSLLDKHDLEFNFTEVDVHELIQSAVLKVGLLLKERDGSITVHADATSAICKLDPDHFTNAMLNLLDNAIKYSEEKPIIEISTKDTKSGIAISIKDQGMGMSKDVSHKIFEKFYRKTSGNIHNIKGFGLGLSYVKAVVDAMGGSIKVQSEMGKGSTFTVVLSVEG